MKVLFLLKSFVLILLLSITTSMAVSLDKKIGTHWSRIGKRFETMDMHNKIHDKSKIYSERF